MAISDEKYILLTTFKRDGTPVASPVWVVGLADGSIGFTTGGDSGKVKRLRRSGEVLVQPCSARGKVTPGTAAVRGSGRLATPAELDEIRAAVRAKYRVVTALMSVGAAVAKLVRRSKHATPDAAVVITLT